LIKGQRELGPNEFRATVSVATPIKRRKVGQVVVHIKAPRPEWVEAFWL